MSTVWWLSHDILPSFLDYIEQSQRLKAMGIPVYPLYIGTHAKTRATFSEIAEITEGSVQALGDTPEALLDVVCQKALSAIGGEALQQLYIKKYMTFGSH
jgi:hypothetical protein